MSEPMTQPTYPNISGELGSMKAMKAEAVKAYAARAIANEARDGGPQVEHSGLIAREMAALAAQTETLRKLAYMLADRLSPVLRQVPNGLAGNAREGVPVPLGEALAVVTESLSETRDTLDSLLSRLEL